jgi:hypothetical protein
MWWYLLLLSWADGVQTENRRVLAYDYDGKKLGPK